MTFRERTVIRAAIDTTKRAWLEAQGGYRKIEDDIQGHELRLRRQAGERLQGHGTRACYLRGCRQVPCVDAYRRYNREWKRASRGVC